MSLEHKIITGLGICMLAFVAAVWGVAMGIEVLQRRNNKGEKK